MLRILALIRHYLPGYKSGGPARTLANMADRLGEEFAFHIVTTDRDAGDAYAYPGIQPGTWQAVGNAKVLYLSPAQRRMRQLSHLLNSLDYDLLYLNSFFPPLTRLPLLLRWLRQVPARPVVLAPRGDLSPGALAIKAARKRLYITLIKRVGLYDGLTWQASSADEQRQIVNVLGRERDGKPRAICIAPNLADRRLSSVTPGPRCKEASSARVVFMSRIARKKNLSTALTWLARVSGRVQFDIYGPLEDELYWEECRSLIARLPANVEAEYKGVLPHDQVFELLSRYHLFLLPTHGENFGHVILEAFCAGCPVLVSDQTPWRELVGSKAGWDVPLSESERFVAVLNEVVAMDQHSFDEWSRSARELGARSVRDPAPVQANRRLFLDAARIPHGRLVS